MLDRFFFDNAERHPDFPALWVDNETFSYGQLANHAHAIAQVLHKVCDEIAEATESAEQAASCLLLAHRTEEAYAGLLGVLAAGQAYVPLGANFPVERNAAIAQRSGARMLLVDSRSEAQLETLRPLLDPAIRIVKIADIHRSSPEGQVSAGVSVSRQRAENDIAYILFTSGTTGVPKGVKVTHANASAYMANQLKLDPAEPGSRFSQIFDLTFDLSVHDMFVCWANAACLYVPPGSDPLILGPFVNEHALTHLGSVPSTAAFLQQFRKLKAGAFPSLRMTMFCSEALPCALALAWGQAAPNSRILNLYGPTEATISCMRYEVDREDMRRFEGGVVPLRWSIPGEETVIIDETGQAVADGIKGELLLGGHQLAAGYISDNPKDHAKFFDATFPGHEATRWYRTGDVASVSAVHGMFFHGRIDGQLKIRGNRIEIQEVEHAVKVGSGSSMVAVVAWPRDAAGNPNGLVAFVDGMDASDDTILGVCRARLPIYGVPNRIVRISDFPVNANGKIDRNALFARCQQNVALATHAG